MLAKSVVPLRNASMIPKFVLCRHQGSTTSGSGTSTTGGKKPPTGPASSSPPPPEESLDSLIGKYKKIMAAEPPVPVLPEVGQQQQLLFPPSVYSKRMFQFDENGLPLLSEKDRSRRLEFSCKILTRIEKDDKFIQSILFSDEGNFRTFKPPGGAASASCPPPSKVKAKNRNESRKLPLIVWCGMTYKDVVGPYFFNSYVTEHSYQRMIQTFMLPRLKELNYPMDKVWFQQDGNPPHRSKKVLKYLSRTFGNRLISYGCATFWPIKSQDLTPLDYFLWDHLKAKLASNYRPSTMDDLKECLTLELENLHPDILEAVVYDFRYRLQSCIDAKGDRFEARRHFT